uniref:Antimicrobial-peptide n=1 Tax=Alligator sinensis TaxID=38654 RepID=A0A2H4ZLE3_ALLSI|nr:antimicrobial-peptide [Alligator sinensis]
MRTLYLLFAVSLFMVQIAPGFFQIYGNTKLCKLNGGSCFLRSCPRQFVSFGTCTRECMCCIRRTRD